MEPKPINQTIETGKKILILLNEFKSFPQQKSYENDIVKELIDLIKIKRNQVKELPENSFYIPNLDLAKSIIEKVNLENSKSNIVEDNYSYLGLLKKEKDNDEMSVLSEINCEFKQDNIAFNEEISRIDFDLESKFDKSFAFNNMETSFELVKEENEFSKSKEREILNKKLSSKLVSVIENVYNKIFLKAQVSIENKNCKIHFIAIFKQMLLELGLSLKHFYDESVRKITINLSFFSFCECFEEVFKLEASYYSYFKYKCKTFILRFIMLTMY